MVIVSFSHCCFLGLSFAVFGILWLLGVPTEFIGDCVAATCTNVGFARSLLMSFMSFDICSIVCCFLFSSSFSRFYVIVLAFSQDAFTFPRNIVLGPVLLVLMLLMLPIVLMSKSSSLNMFDISGFCSFVLSTFRGVSGITVPERGVL